MKLTRGSHWIELAIGKLRFCAFGWQGRSRWIDWWDEPTSKGIMIAYRWELFIMWVKKETTNAE